MVLTVDTGIRNLHHLDVVTSIILWRPRTQGHISTPARPVRANTGFMKPQKETVSIEPVLTKHNLHHTASKRYLDQYTWISHFWDVCIMALCSIEQASQAICVGQVMGDTY